jgi:SHAQKYF class myb-like DNA-binding protein
MSYELNTPSSPSVRFDPFDMSSSFPFKPLSFAGRPHSLTLAEQAELEFELRYRGNMIVDQQRKIQQLEEDLKRAHEQMEMMSSQLSSYEQERLKEKKKPQSRYWTPEEHQRFLEALSKYGHKDVKAISMHVSTRNATQVRTHAQKYFLRLERERRKKSEDGTSLKDFNDGYDSLDDGSPFPDTGSPMDEPSPTLSPIPNSAPASPLPLPVRVPIPRRRRSVSMITPTLMKFAHQHRDAVLSMLSPSWTADDFDQFVKGLVALVDKQEDITQVCHAIREGFLSHHTLDEVETCYRHLHKFLKQKPVTSSPKRRRAISKPECLHMGMGMSMGISSPGMDGPLPAMGGLSLNPSSSSGNSFSFLNNGNNGNSTMAGFQYPTIANVGLNGISPNTNNHAHNSNGNGVHPIGLSTFMRPPVNVNVNGVEYAGVPSMPSVMDMDLNTPSLSMNSMGSLGSHSWNSLSFSFDLQNVNPPVPSLGLHSSQQGAPLVSSHN